MLSPRWRKLLGDLGRSRQRTAVMALALCIGVFGVGAMLSGYSILTREIGKNYLSTNPASATIETSGVDKPLVEKARLFPGIADAEARATIVSRVRVGDDWMRMLLFVINDFNDLHLNTFRRESGAWPPPEGTMLVERSSLKVLKNGVGDSVAVKTPRTKSHDILISGLVHDTGLAPSWQEQTVYGYIIRETAAALGEKPVLDELRIRIADHPFDRSRIEETAQKLSAWLQSQGVSVREIKVPPPGKHPHQTQMTGILFLFIAFSLMALILSAVLVAALIADMLARQVREIGVMKAVGGRAGQIAGIYYSMVGLLGAASVALAIPASLFAGGKLADAISRLLNFTITSYHVPLWVFMVQIASGVLVPLFMASFPIFRGSRMTVREAISDYGVSVSNFGKSRLDAALGALQARATFLLLALRNMFRRRGRLVLALGLLAAGGGMFMTSLNVRDGWMAYINRIYTDRHYDAEVRLNEPTEAGVLRSTLARVPGIKNVEFWGYGETAVAQPGMIDLARTYPDQGHGSFHLIGAPPETTMVTFPLLFGRWLRTDDTDAVVINQFARSLMPNVRIGDNILLSLNGRPVKWRVAGIVEEIGFPAAAYVTDSAYAQAAGTKGRAQMVRIATTAADPPSRAAVIRTIEQELAAANISVREALPLAVLKTAVGEHVAVLVRTLIAAAILLGLIGVLGLASAMGMNVIERTRELGVMRAIGATPAVIVRAIILEGVLIGAASWLFAVLISVPLSLLVGRIVGMMSFKVPLPLIMSPHAMAGWLVVVLMVSALAGAWPARRASELTVREALAYE